MDTSQIYTTRLGVGLGLIDETRVLLELWQPGMTTADLYRVVLHSGSLPNISARRLKNIINELFAMRYLVEGDYPAWVLKALMPFLTHAELSQLLYIYTCRVHAVLADYIVDEYWPRYAGGNRNIDNEDAREFVLRALEQGKTERSWSPKTIQNVAGYVTGCCADFGLLEPGKRRVRQIIPFRLETRVGAFLAYDLHFAGMSDNSVIMHRDWQLFGMEPLDVRELMKRLALMDFVIVQSAADITHISWKFRDWEDLINVFSQK